MFYNVLLQDSCMCLKGSCGVSLDMKLLSMLIVMEVSNGQSYMILVKYVSPSSARKSRFAYKTSSGMLGLG